MLNANDLEQLKAKGISEKQIEEQLACFVKGFPFLEIAASASVEKGIMVISKEEQASYMDAWDAYLAKNKKIVKFVPASGAASRMFKNLYEFLSADYKEPMNAFSRRNSLARSRNSLSIRLWTRSAWRIQGKIFLRW